MKKYAYTNGKILDGTRNMKVKEGLGVLTEGDKITGLVPADKIPAGCETIDLQGGYLMAGTHQYACTSGGERASRRRSSGIMRH